MGNRETLLVPLRPIPTMRDKETWETPMDRMGMLESPGHVELAGWGGNPHYENGASVEGIQNDRLP